MLDISASALLKVGKARRSVPKLLARAEVVGWAEIHRGSLAQFLPSAISPAPKLGNATASLPYPEERRSRSLDRRSIGYAFI